ncbi:MAG: GNAT family N-acetyltransferase [Schwartzia succinivorans]|uniref:GNAT family N-acetyltransferase n=1 Tax=Schwartzia succinivorans TaxID=55507 RepID=UPI0023552CBF|nr:GNAT family N-acetyltransferase [Schwartzia succinivorans]MBE6096531.1 GNAT family N-acetyltransferase [Schwartzia succinivorans]
MYDFDSLYKKIKELKILNTKLYTNCFFFSDKLVELASLPSTRFIAGESFAALAIKEKEFSRIFFWINNLNDVQKLLSLIKGQSEECFVIELVGSESDVNIMKDRFMSSGAVCYAVLERWRAGSIRQPQSSDDINIRYSLIEKKDIKKAFSMLMETFDSKISHLPSERELHKLYEQRLLFGAYHKSELVGTCCMENIGETGKYCYETAILREYRGQGIGKRLKGYAWGQSPDAKVFTSWVAVENIASQKVNVALGLEKDGLITVVLEYT